VTAKKQHVIGNNHLHRAADGKRKCGTICNIYGNNAEYGLYVIRAGWRWM
jgi:hypothetical protein